MYEDNFYWTVCEPDMYEEIVNDTASVTCMEKMSDRTVFMTGMRTS